MEVHHHPKVEKFSQLNGNTSLIIQMGEANHTEVDNGTLLTTDKQTIAEYYSKLYTFHRISKYHTYLCTEDKKRLHCYWSKFKNIII